MLAAAPTESLRCVLALEVLVVAAADRGENSRVIALEVERKGDVGPAFVAAEQIVEFVGESEVLEMLKDGAKVRAALFGKEVHRPRALFEYLAHHLRLHAIEREGSWSTSTRSSSPSWLICLRIWTPSSRENRCWESRSPSALTRTRATGVPHSLAIVASVLRSTISPTLSRVPITWSPNSAASRTATLEGACVGVGVA